MSKHQPKLTPWFPGTVRPVRPGVYERKPPAGAAVWSEWTGTLWMVGTMARSRMGMQRIVSRSQDWPWRGLSRPGGRT